MDINKLGRLFKGEQYEIDIQIPYSGGTFYSFELKFFTNDPQTYFNVPLNHMQAEGSTIHVSIRENDFDNLDDGVLNYNLSYNYDGVDHVIYTNTLHYLDSPCNAPTPEEIYQDGYDDGYADGIDTCEDCEEYYSDGYTSGHTDGMADQKALLATTAFTVNGTYTRENGWNEVEVNIAQTGHTDQELEKAYNDGVQDGVDAQIAKLATTAFTENGTYTRADGWKGVEVNVPAPKYVGQDKTYNISENGTTRIAPDTGYDGITGGTINVSVKPQPYKGETKNYNLTSNGTTNITVDNGYDGITGGVITVNVAQTGHTDAELEEAYDEGMADQKALLASLTVNVNGTYTRENGWNEVVVDVQPVVEDCLVFEAVQANSRVSFSIPSGHDPLTLYYSVDGKQTFTAWDGSQITLANVGDRVYIYGENACINNTDDSALIAKFLMSGIIDAYGSVDSLLHRGGVNSLTTRTYNSLFRGCSALRRAPELPNMNLANSCYEHMFAECTGLTIAPALPATTLANGCYASMFTTCRSLVKAPELPATTLDTACYFNMFSLCTAMVIPPALPATTMAASCYSAMFANCTGLLTAPVLPATTLAAQCYASMFQACTNLLSAPALPATTLAARCYEYMFALCSSLRHAPLLPATTLVEQCYREMFAYCTNLLSIDVLASSWDETATDKWLDHVTSSGIIYKPAGTTIPSGVNGVPTNWTTIDIANN